MSFPLHLHDFRDYIFLEKRLHVWMDEVKHHLGFSGEDKAASGEGNARMQKDEVSLTHFHLTSKTVIPGTPHCSMSQLMRSD